MPASVKKGPFVESKLMKKVLRQKKTSERQPIRTWSRRSTVVPEFVNHTFEVHAGRGFARVFVVEDMVGHKLGEFAPTRTFRGHSSRKIAAPEGPAAAPAR